MLYLPEKRKVYFRRPTSLKPPDVSLLFSNVDPISGIVKPLDETLDAKFFDINQLPEMAFDHDKLIIRDWKKKFYN